MVESGASLMGEGRGTLLVISGPSGVGKTTLAHRVEEALQGVFSVSVTTRPQTAADRAGVDYTFVSVAEFEAMRDAGALLEWAEVFGNYYGTPRQPVEDAVAAGQTIILEIDVEGAVQVHGKVQDIIAVFVLPPSEQTLLGRLRNRKREDESVIQRRFAKAKAEIERAQNAGVYDHFVVNDVLERAAAETVDVVRSLMAAR